jgi:hypothetical protein
VRLQGGQAVPGDEPGSGIAWNEAMVKRYGLA